MHALRCSGLALVIAPTSAQDVHNLPSVTWQKLDTVPFAGKQDDIFFVNERVGWYGNGKGLLYKTVDGGGHWDEQWNEPGTFIRALGFIDEQTGIMGNVGTDYFPGVKDETPLYRTADGGETWNPAVIKGPLPKGICAIDVYKKSFIDHGVLGYQTTLRAGGRVGGPAYLLRSDDNGQTWLSRDMSALTAMILDIKFVSNQVGFIAGATDANVEKSHALILRTLDGGKTWTKVYESARLWEITWKIAFPTTKTGYVTVQNYDPTATNKARYVAKTTDGGRHWSEQLVTENHGFSEFGIAFMDALRGWLGGSNLDYETTDGGKSWLPVDFGKAVNKIRLVRSERETRLFAIGSSVYEGRVTTQAALDSTAGAASDIDAAMSKSAEAWNRGDIIGYAELYENSPDTLLIGPRTIRGFQATLQFFQDNYSSPASRGTLSYSGIEIQPLDDRFATVTGKFHLERSSSGGGNVDGFYLLVFEKTNVGWKIIRDDSSVAALESLGNRQ